MVEDSYYRLLNSYGWEVTDTINGGYGPMSWTDEATEYRGENNPFYFMRTGGFNNGSVIVGGYGASLWSQTAVIIKWSNRPTDPEAIFLAIYNDIGPMRVDTNRSNGLALRCLTQ